MEIYDLAFIRLFYTSASSQSDKFANIIRNPLEKQYTVVPYNYNSALPGLNAVIFLIVDHLQREQYIVEKTPPNWVYFCRSSQHDSLQLSNCIVWRLFCLGVLVWFYFFSPATFFFFFCYGRFPQGKEEVYFTSGSLTGSELT